MTKLQYIGKMDFPGVTEDLRLWTICDPASEYHRSSRTLAGLQELGIVKTGGI